MEIPQLRKAEHSGFTVLELLASVTVVVILVALLLPAIQSARESARKLQCSSRLRQLGIALHAHASSSRRLPAGWTLDASRSSAFGWAVNIIPYLDEQANWERNGFQRSLSTQISNVPAEPIAAFACPSDFSKLYFDLYAEADSHEKGGQSSTTVLATLPSANYAGVFGESDPDDVAGSRGEGAFIAERGIRMYEFRHGTSKTLMVGERTARKLPTTWLGFDVNGEDAQGRVTGNAFLGPNRNDADECEFDSRHLNGVNFLWADGHVTFITNSIEARIYRYSAHRFP